MILGVLGTMVWDTIEHPDGETVQRWGGITYSLVAAAAALPEGWSIRPIVRLGADLADPAWRFLESVPCLDRPGAVVEVDEPNNQVHLSYRDRHDRDERLTGGVAGWAWSDLAPRLEGLDGLFVNLISGFELDAPTVVRLSDAFRGPRYADLHSLVLGVGADGLRVPRPPDDPTPWLQAFHVVQVNRRELALLAGDGTPEDVARAAVSAGTAAVVVTRGPDGADWFAHHDGPVWSAVGPHDPSATGAPPADTPVRTGQVALDTQGSAGDPTGCGDVWGATCFVHLMRGRSLRDAMDAANRAAARNVTHRGADGLYQHLRAGS